MKPSEQFANLKQAVEGMGEGQDKDDLLSLFQLADKQHDIIVEFKNCKHNLYSATRRMRKDVEEWREWRDRHLPGMKSLLVEARGEKKVVALKRVEPITK